MNYDQALAYAEGLKAGKEETLREAIRVVNELWVAPPSREGEESAYRFKRNIIEEGKLVLKEALTAQFKGEKEN